MALEYRGNRICYYRKERSGDRVRSVYQASGPLAILMDEYVRNERAAKEREQRDSAARFNTELRREGELDAIVNRLSDLAGTAKDAVLLANGFHRHSRSWRRRRG